MTCRNFHEHQISFFSLNIVLFCLIFILIIWSEEADLGVILHLIAPRYTQVASVDNPMLVLGLHWQQYYFKNTFLSFVGRFIFWFPKWIQRLLLVHRALIWSLHVSVEQHWARTLEGLSETILKVMVWSNHTNNGEYLTACAMLTTNITQKGETQTSD